jgi:hypothetical protein
MSALLLFISTINLELGILDRIRTVRQNQITRRSSCGNPAACERLSSGMTYQDVVVRLAEEAHAAHWQMSGDEGTGDKLAKLITETWQRRLQETVPGRFAVEYGIASHLKQRIDVVDPIDGITLVQNSSEHRGTVRAA